MGILRCYNKLMLARRLAALLFAVAIAIVLPSIALAASNPQGFAGLVPCGVSSDPSVATECEACNLVQLIQNVITFLIGLSVPLAMGMFAWAGVLYFTSATNTENIGKAKNIFKSTAFGFALALASWIIVNTILFTVLDSNQYPNSSWFRVDCTKLERPIDKQISDVLNKHLLPVPEVSYVSGYTNSIGCPPGSTMKTAPYGGTAYCEDVNGKISDTLAVQAPLSNGVGYCNSSNLGAFGSNSSVMSCILQRESSCNPLAVGDSGFSIGLSQINMTANNVICNGVTYDCKSAFSGAYTCRDQGCGRYRKNADGSYTFLGAVTIQDSAKAEQCKQMLQNPRCNLETAQYLASNSRGLSNWSTYGSCK